MFLVAQRNVFWPGYQQVTSKQLQHPTVQKKRARGLDQKVPSYSWHGMNLKFLIVLHVFGLPL